MKTIAKFIIVILTGLAFSCDAQEFIASRVKLSKEAIGKVSTVTSDNAVIRLTEGSNNFSFSLQLYPILSGLNENDSIATLNQKITMTYKAEFPISDPDFYNIDTKSKQYTMDGDLTVNGFTRPVKISFYLMPAVAADVSSRDIHGYPFRISFALEINPAEYGLDIETAKFTEKITVMVDNGIINRTTSEP
jgi:hypothetical protein